MITCAQKMRKNTISCLHTIRKNKDDLANTNPDMKRIDEPNPMMAAQSEARKWWKETSKRLHD